MRESAIASTLSDECCQWIETKSSQFFPIIQRLIEGKMAERPSGVFAHCSLSMAWHSLEVVA
jgi:hypothetical protein